MGFLALNNYNLVACVEFLIGLLAERADGRTHGCMESLIGLLVERTWH